MWFLVVENEDLRLILENYNTVAIIGLSKDPSKDSRQVARYLIFHGYEIIPINPFADMVLGRKAYSSLLDLPEELKKRVEIVDIFRPSEQVLPHVMQAIKLKEIYNYPKVIWMQLGIINEEASRIAEEAGMVVVMDRCIMQEHKRLM
jgi:predicted CoA-binding protein